MELEHLPWSPLLALLTGAYAWANRVLHRSGETPRVTIYEMAEGYEGMRTFCFQANLGWEVVKIEVLESDGIKDRIAQDLFQHTRAGDSDINTPIGPIWSEYCNYPEGNQQRLQVFYVNNIHREAGSFVYVQKDREKLVETLDETQTQRAILLLGKCMHFPSHGPSLLQRSSRLIVVLPVRNVIILTRNSLSINEVQMA